jgi:CubicO group peptidase (beta-lactamase class C family)
MDRRLCSYKEVRWRSALAAAAVLALLAGCTSAQPSPFTFQNGIGMRADGPFMSRYTDASGAIAHADRSNWFETRFGIDAFSRLDEVLKASVSPAAPPVRPWIRAPAEPDVSYEAPANLGGGRHTLDGYLSRNPTTGLLIAQGDAILAERYQYGRTDRQRMTSFSMAKTVIAMLVGIAVAEGRIRSIEDNAADYVPELRGTEYGATPLRHLLTMSSGVKFREDYDGADDVSILSRRTLFAQSPGGAAAVAPFNARIAAPGERWYYASAETFVLAVVLRTATGKSVADYFADRIWRHLGTEDVATWQVDGSGQEVGYMGFNATLRDYARLGMMMATGGRVGDRQVVPAAWIADMTRSHFSGAQTGRWYGYGYQTWIFPDNSGAFALLGVRGQVLYVDPARRLVLVHTAVRPSSRDPGGAETVALWFALRGRIPKVNG